MEKINNLDIAAFVRDGAICLRNIFDHTWIERIRDAVDRDMANPGPLSDQVWQGGRFLNDNFMWTRDADFRAFIFESPAAAIAATLLQSENINLLNDNLLVKEPGANVPTQWHNDYPYWPIQGYKCCTIWLPLDPVSRENGRLEYIKGSHQWNQWLLAQEDSSRLIKPEPDNILTWNMQPGDCLVHHLLTIHGGSGNCSSKRRRALATVWAGDDIRYDFREDTWFLKSIHGLGIPECDSIKSLKSGESINCDLFPRITMDRHFL